MAAVVSANFGLVHAPPEFDYATDIDDLADEIVGHLQVANEDWEEIWNAFTMEELHFLRWQICWKVDISSPVVVNSASFRVIGQTPCINDVLNATMYPYVFLGDLPASTPPYSIKMVFN